MDLYVSLGSRTLESGILTKEGSDVYGQCSRSNNADTKVGRPIFNPKGVEGGTQTNSTISLSVLSPFVNECKW